ncbi:serine/threonine-protein kinase Pink1, mitochondrial [Phlebotomus argentipes]|uniref:serine/threonine-protein kinase Pink1, mitochondrial n=1 Tax=Phlebotomus argentipes TaxID=94469 RepID=UPI002892AA2C|nr:serine/threonine-protein kinase Pink1, mitochondrial [Phlebotomus argentipes]
MIRYLSTRLVHHGRVLWRHQNRRQIHTKIAENSRKRRQNAPKTEQAIVRYQEPFQRYGFSRFVLQARRLLLDNVVNRTSSSPPVELRAQLVKRFFSNDSVPVLAFVGIAAVSEGAVLLKDAELEETCVKIRETVVKFRPSWDEEETSVGNTPIGLDDLEIGAPIAKGCSAVVHAAALKRHSMDSGQNRSYPLALKIMFNYDVQSNALAIVRAMFRETVPAKHRALEVAGFWQHLADQATLLPPHPNVVSMLGVFCAQMPNLEGARTLYPSALPPRLHESGFGRNMSLFLLMRRYHASLADFLASKGGKTSTRWALLLFAQLLEAVTHLNRYGVAHRDLKSDNILIDVGADGTPGLVVADFGCCLADKKHGLRVPYPTAEIDKGGNTALMAPEIITQNPGTFATLDYTKADLWTSGAIAYEIFGMANPFYNTQLKSYSYRDEDLPALDDDVPLIVKKLVGNLLQRNPKKRLSADVAANVMQLFLWAPSSWLRSSASAPAHSEILQWLLCLTSKVLYENAMDSRGQRSAQFTEYFLISSFLVRASLRRIEKALLWIRRVVAEEQLEDEEIKV